MVAPTAHGMRWSASFDVSDVAPLIVCRGPVRKEALDVFAEMGIHHCGVLVSEKDSVTFAHALAPELRTLDAKRVHLVADYSGADQATRTARIGEIIGIARTHGYNAIFAGYGFMAEDATFVAAIEAAGLTFIGPCSRTVNDAGAKDIAKRTALTADISVIPGEHDVAAKALLARHPGQAALARLAAAHALGAPPAHDVDAAEALLAQARERGIELLSVDELLAAVETEIATLFRAYPDRRLRIKAVGGGGGKGQRVLAPPSTFAAPTPEARIAAASALAQPRTREVWAEVGATGAAANRNVLIELNVEAIRHLEVQLVGNGDWCVALGARDCSLQMHEQKLLEVSFTDESLARAAAGAEGAAADALERDRQMLTRMEAEAARFGAAVGLDSVSTFECIADQDRHYFMEMNTRIQVEHRVSELCYSLRFVNPEDAADAIVVDSLVAVMVLLARHGKRLPRPQRVPRVNDAVEVRLNAMDDALSPAAGGNIEAWTPPQAGEIRDDQGISTRNPDTGAFVRYHLAGSYDSNVALLLTTAATRTDVYERMLQILRRMRMRGHDLQTNLDFHRGLLCWLLANGPHARVETRFVPAWLAAVGRLFVAAQSVDVEAAFAQLRAGAGRDAALAAVIDAKQTLIVRPLMMLLARPHALAGFVAASAADVVVDAGGVRWRRNPIDVLHGLYEHLDMFDEAARPPSELIWAQDLALLTRARGFYDRVQVGLGVAASDFATLSALLAQEHPPRQASPLLRERWPQVRAAHTGFQAGLALLALPQLLATDAGFHALRGRPDGRVEIPADLLDGDEQARMRKVLERPPAESFDEIVAAYGGTFYGREAPGLPRFVEVGDHFDAGSPLYVIEVMKMFNKVHARFPGRVDALLLGDRDGVVVRKGQPLFAVTPDQRPEVRDAGADRLRIAERTRELVTRCGQVAGAAS